MRAYAHWLDGTYRTALIGGGPKSSAEECDRNAEATIKSIALFGGSMVLGDVQIVDSPVIWKLFADRGFQQYLKVRPDFFELIANPVNPSADRRWEIVTSGLHRAVKAGWISSTLEDPADYLSFAQTVAKLGPTGDFKSLLLQRRNNPDLLARSGLLSAVRHFYYRQEAPVVEPLPDRQQFNFYDVLLRVRDSPDLHGEDRAHLEAGVNRIERDVENPEERVRRTAIHKHLNFEVDEDARLWRTIVQAWNVAAQKSLCDADGHIGQMRNSPPVGAYVDTLADVMLMAPSQSQRSGVRRLVSRLIPQVSFGWHPGELSWTDIANIAEDNGCRESCGEIEVAVASGDEDVALEAVKSFGREAAPFIRTRFKQPVPWWVWALGPIVLKFGVPDAPLWGEVISIAQFAERSLVWGINKLQDEIIAARVVESAKSLPIART